MSTATLSMPLDEWQQHQQNLKAAEEKISALTKELEATKLLVGDEKTTKALNELGRAMLTVVRYAVSGMPPESNANWPARELRKIVGLMPTLAGFGQNEIELGNELLIFAAECERWDRDRALRDGKCPECRGRGVITKGQGENEMPCDCSASDTVRFKVGDQILTGAQLKSRRDLS